MAYTPKLSYENSCVLRRIAWPLKEPMTSQSIGQLRNLLNISMQMKYAIPVRNHQNAAHVCFMAIDNLWRDSMPSLYIKMEVIK